MATWPYYLFAIAVAMLPIQFGVNAQLASWVEAHCWRAVLFAVGTAVLLVAALIFAWRNLGRARFLRGAVVGLGRRLLGAFYVLGLVVQTAPRLRLLFAFILAGQAVASLAVDHFGWVGFEENPVTPGRLVESRSWPQVSRPSVSWKAVG